MNTSSYHPQTDGLIKKFNRTMINMISKHIDAGRGEWYQQLQLLLFAYHSKDQEESIQEGPLFISRFCAILYCACIIPMMSYTKFSRQSNLLHVESSRMNFLQFLVVQNFKSEEEQYLPGSLQTQLDVWNTAIASFAQISKSVSDTSSR